MIDTFLINNNYNYQKDISLKKYNTYRLDVIASYLVSPKNIKELIELLRYLKDNNIKHMILGNGSNIIFANDKYEGVIIRLEALNKITYDNNKVTAECGVPLIKLALDTINKGYEGLSFACGVPGNVGASTAMNAGCYGSNMQGVVETVKILDKDLNIKELSNEEMEFEYRDSYVKKNPGIIVLSTTFNLTEGNIEEMKLLAKERKEKRLLSQPLEFPSAGSVFRNPEGLIAGKLIEECGLKGYNINGAEVSTKHANFIVNTGKATGKDIIDLIEYIKTKVKEQHGVELHLEQIIID